MNTEATQLWAGKLVRYHRPDRPHGFRYGVGIPEDELRESEYPSKWIWAKWADTPAEAIKAYEDLQEADFSITNLSWVHEDYIEYIEFDTAESLSSRFEQEYTCDFESAKDEKVSKKLSTRM